MRRRSRILLVLLLVAGVLAGLHVWRSMRLVWDMAEVQAAVGGQVSLSFNDDRGSGRPTSLPEFLDDAIDDALGWIFRDGQRRMNAHEHFRSLFRGPVDEIHLDTYQPLDGRTLAAFARFQNLRRLDISLLGDKEDYGPSVTQLCATVRAMPKLEEFFLMTTGITDATIAPLRGHPSLWELELHDGKLTPRCLDTLRTLPKLRALDCGESIATPTDQKAIEAGLPSVVVRFWGE